MKKTYITETQSNKSRYTFKNSAFGYNFDLIRFYFHKKNCENNFIFTVPFLKNQENTELKENISVSYKKNFRYIKKISTISFFSQGKLLINKFSHRFSKRFV